jgi:predicted hydrocarbon binding protein
MNRSNRRISNRYLRHILQAIEDELGSPGLHRVLRQAELERYLGSIPQPDQQTSAYASDLARLAQAIRAYYGRGARGSLHRVGHALWQNMATEAPLLQKLRLSLLPLLSRTSRAEMALKWMVWEMRQPDGEVSLRLSDGEWLLIDSSSDFTFNQSAEDSLCWITVGMIQEALSRTMDRRFDIEETSCRASGATSCRFQIALP